MAKWIESWREEAMFSGMPGVGAEDCAYLTALDIELKKLCQAGVTIGSIDVYKCFDQLLRPLILQLAEVAGMPKQVLRAYGSFIENMSIMFQLSGALGEAHEDRTSIPQGCPFSMAMVALLMKPWMSVMREAGVSPRALADDLFILAQGRNHGRKAIDAMEKSREYFKDIGALVAAKKCFMSSTRPKTRAFLRRCDWGKERESKEQKEAERKESEQKERVRMNNHFRDLGFHLSLDSSGSAPTTTERIRKAIGSLNK